MFKVQTRETTPFGKEIAAVWHDGRLVGAASLPFIEWMLQKVPNRQLSAEQCALVQWYREEQAQV